MIVRKLPFAHQGIAPVNSQHNAQEETFSWTAVSSIIFVMAVGLFVLAMSYSAGRGNQTWSNVAFWAGIILIFVPAGLRLVSSTASRTERVTLVVLVTLALYGVKVLHSPSGFTFSDEFQHYRTLNDVLNTGHLFTANSLLPISPFYPGLEIVTHAIVTLGGLSIFEAGILAVGIARLLMALSLFLLYEQVSSSARLAGIASLIYMANTNFIFWGAQFAYESFALPLALFLLYLLVARAKAGNIVQPVKTATLWLIIPALVVSHHMTTYWLLAIMVSWLVIQSLYPRLTVLANRQQTGWLASVVRLWRVALPARHTRTRNWHLSPLVVIFMVMCCALWLLFSAVQTIRYIMTPMSEGVSEFIRQLLGQSTFRQLFTDFTGYSPPAWERAISLLSVVLILLGMLFGLRRAWRHYHHNVPAVLFILSALLYPMMLPLRLSSRGWEIANRSSEFVFVGLAFVIAVAVIAASRMNHRQMYRVLLTVAIAIVFMGGLTSGWAFWARIPGPYLVAADTRSIEEQGIMAAQWSKDHLGSHNLIGADRINRLLLGTYGNQDLVTNNAARVNVAPVILSDQFGRVEKYILQLSQVRYLAVDQRLSTNLPVVGVYFEVGEPDSYTHRAPPSLLALNKFDTTTAVNRTFDNGAIVIYDVGEINHAP